jgi:hypothetical protein
VFDLLIQSYTLVKQTNTPLPALNGAILVECKTLRHVVASAAEAETGGIFHNVQVAIPIRRILTALGHPQPLTRVKTDNSTANGYVYDNITQKKSKSWDMRYNYLRDKELQQLIEVYLKPGTNNDGDYFTKHHAPLRHHLATRPRYVRDQLATMFNNINCIHERSLHRLKTSHPVQGCVEEHGTCPPNLPPQSSQPNMETEYDGWRSQLKHKMMKLQQQVRNTIEP